MNKIALWKKTILWGSLSLALYVFLFANQDSVLQQTSKGAWNFLVLVAIAFLFSYVHGAFTGAFWESLGIKGKRAS
ncbi:MAG: hypothetical protein G8345_08070 [Magnetococcales bacterium]|nr:hypothetical protein [Magnetococcales bacterium]